MNRREFLKCIPAILGGIVMTKFVKKEAVINDNRPIYPETISDIVCDENENWLCITTDGHIYKSKGSGIWREIVIDRAAMLAYIEERNRALDEGGF